MSTVNKEPKLALVFDVETTGLIPKKNTLTLQDYPHIIQFSFILFNISTFSVERCYNVYIQVDDTVQITDVITNITGINSEMCRTYGVPIQDALLEFYNAYFIADIVIAHNIKFDQQMIKTEIFRHMHDLYKYMPLYSELFVPSYKREIYCTMHAGIDICNIMVTCDGNVDGSTYTYKKFPKLSELYKCLFGTVPENLHNSLIDTIVCLRCFLKMNLNKDIHNVKYNHIMKELTKQGYMYALC